MTQTATSHRRPVQLARPVPVPLDVAVAALVRDPLGVIGSSLQAPVGETAYTRLGLEVPGGRQITREVRLGFGRVLEDDDDGTTALPVWWEDAEHPELFPTFDGGLELHPGEDGTGTELRLVGSYLPPLGALGRFADGVLGRRIVAACLEAFLAQVADRLVRMAETTEDSRR